MKQKRAEQDRSHLSHVLIAILLLIGLLLLLSFPQGKENLQLPQSVLGFSNSEKLPDSVKKSIEIELKRGDSLRYIKTSKIETENWQTAARIQGADALGIELGNEEFPTAVAIDLSTENPFEQLEDDMVDPFEPTTNHSPADRIYAMVAKDQWEQEYDEEYRRAFVKAFKANAAADGWDINLNKKMEIIGLRRKKQIKALRFPDSVTDMSHKASLASDDSGILTGESRPTGDQ